MNSRTLKRRYGCLLLSCLCLMVIALGCNQQAAPDYASLGLAEVSGTIRMDQAPLANAHVMFEAPDKTYSFGKTNGSGKYTLMFNSQQSGVLPGKKIVRIQLGKFSEEDDDEPAVGEGAADRDPVLEISTDASELPQTYHRNSQLTATVVAGVQTIDFDLKSKGSTTSATQ